MYFLNQRTTDDNEISPIVDKPYKGTHHAKEEKVKFDEATGAHFDYQEICNKLLKLKKTLKEPKRVMTSQ